MMYAFTICVLTLIGLFSLSLASPPEIYPRHYSSLLDLEGFGVMARRPYVSANLNVTFNDQQSEFSKIGKFAKGHNLPAKGRLIYIKPNDTNGCNFPKDIEDAEVPWIALIPNNGCDFHLTIRSAKNTHLAGVIIYNGNSTELEEIPVMLRSNISIVFAYLRNGQQLAQLLESGANVTVEITVGGTFYEPLHSKQSLSLTAVLLLCLGWLLYYYANRFTYITAKHKLTKRMSNEIKKTISKIPTRSVNNEDKELAGESDCCPVCIEHYKVNDTIRDLPCSHVFHKNCIDPWLLEHRTCPLCKKDVLRLCGFVFTGSQESILPVDMEEGLEDQDNTDTGMTTSAELNYSMQNTVIDLEQFSSEPISSAYSYNLVNPNAVANGSEECQTQAQTVIVVE
ncbi:E3 ubiquitin-protein ligase goliath-like isoform X2 [Rhodnius prolixus]|uniref:E3 ubiquitin-protein ligase goliath-like isoform X2 n=1 Tax=Rhodnius prolixus TaxID=13249 RepID=UPI003D18D0A1